MKPVRVGVYESSYYARPGTYRYWDGKRWYFNSTVPAFAEKNYHDGHSGAQYHKWRGLAEPPK